MRLGRLVLAGALLAATPNLGIPAPSSPEAVAVRAAAHPGFGRLVLDWPVPVAVDSWQRDQRLTLRFARPFAADLGPVMDALGDYLVGLERTDPREIVLRLAPPTTARLEVHDDRIVVVDLQRGAAPSGAVTVRTGVHDGFLRIVLDWPEPIDVLAEAEGGRLRLRFERAAAIDAATIGERGRALLEAASASESDGGSELRLVLKAGVRAQAFKVEGRQVVIDLYEPSRAPPAANASMLLAEAAGQPAAAPRERAPPMPAPPKPAPPEARLAASELPEPAAAPPPAGTAPPTLALAAVEVEDGLALDFNWTQPTAAAFLLRAGYLWSVFAAVAAPTEAAVLPSLASPAPAWLGPGELVAAAGGTALRFALRRPLAARVERTGNRWRVVLGVAAAPPRAAQLERLPDPSRLRMVTGEAARLIGVDDPEVGDRLELWPLLTPGLGQPVPQRLVDFELLATAQGLAWRARSDQLRTAIMDGAIELWAPEGLRLSAQSIAPPDPPARAAEPPAGLTSEPRVSEASAPPRPEFAEPTARAPADATTATPPVGGPAIETAEAPGAPADHGGPPAAAAEQPAPMAPGRPALVAEAPAARLQHEAAPPAEVRAAAAPLPATPVGPLGLGRHAPATRASLADQRALWQRRVLDATAADRPTARLDLARFLLAHGLASEALAVLSAATAGGALADGSQQLARQALTGAAQLLMDRVDEAAVGLEMPGLNTDPEVALWRAVLAGARADWPRAAQELDRSNRTLDGYPAPLQLRLGLPAARITIEAGDQAATGRLLGLLQALELGPIERARIAFVDGLAQARRGAVDDAERIWGGLEQSQDRPTRIEAGYARVQLLLDAGRLSPAEALARLAAARPLWRPHRREAAMLDTLARLHMQNDEPSRALDVWQELLSHFPGAPDRPRISNQMREVFVATLLPSDGIGIGAIRAYALYRKFPELVPDGAPGERLRRQLAAELAGLDLIAPAADLLAPLLDHLNGPAKAQTGAELAELWLRAPAPAAALAALDRSELGNLPDELQAQRIVLRARALAAHGQPEAALALLEDGVELIQRRLRAELLWQQRAWPRLTAALEDLLQPYAEQDTPLAEAEQDLVIKLALAYARQGQVRALTELRARFGAAMRGQAGEPAFLLATLTPSPAPEPEAALVIAEQHVERARAYLDGLRAR